MKLIPTYKYNPDPTKDPYFIHVNGKMIIKDQEFELDGYLSEAIMEADHIEFVKDEPYISPIICSKTGASIDLEVPDCGDPVDIIVYVPTGGKCKVYFNNNIATEKFITVTNSGPIMRSVSTHTFKTINGRGSGECCIAVVPATQYAGKEIPMFVNG